MRRSPIRTAAYAMVLLLAGLASHDAHAEPQTSAFTYQGLLESGGVPVTDFVDIRFTLWDAETGGTQFGTLDVASIQPEDGVFSVDLDFGTNPFSTNEARWLQIEVSPAEMNMYDNLGRVALRATTYSLSTRGIEVRNNGQVVIGDDPGATPDEALSIGTTATPADRFIRLDTGGGSSYSSGIKFRHFNSNIGFDIVSSDAALRGLNFIDATNGSFSRLFIERDTGLIGMGTTEPLSDLHLGSFTDNNDRTLTIATPGGNLFRSSLALIHGIADNGWRIESDERPVTTGLHFIDMTGTEETVMFLENDTARVGIGTIVPFTRLHVNDDQFTFDPSVVSGRATVIASAQDSIIDVISDDSGTYSSGISLKQVDAMTGLIEDNWGLLLRTSGGLMLSYGSGQNSSVNETVMQFTEAGSVGVGDVSPEGRFDVSYDANSEGIGVDVEGLNTSPASVGVSSSQAQGRAIYGQTTAATGTNFGVYGEVNATNTTGWGVFSNGRLGASGTKSFCIDHPLDPANWYLLHYSTESPEPLNTYSGNAVFDHQGLAVVRLPDYFQSLNTNVRYHLTPVGAAMPNLHVARKVQDNTFVVAGGVPGAEVSWQIIGTRNDPYVRMIGAPVEVQKGPGERGRFLMPELYDMPAELSLNAKRITPSN
ncbi:MAG: hypothetical protein Tsb0013_16070 [Phycisphaerales bacterium]